MPTFSTASGYGPKNQCFYHYSKSTANHATKRESYGPEAGTIVACNLWDGGRSGTYK